MKAPIASGLVAEFTAPGPFVAAVRAAREAGFSVLGAYSPFPCRDLEELLGLSTRSIPIVAAVAAVVGAAITYATQYWTNVQDYALNVGGRPLHAWPAFLPATIIVASLWSAVGALIAMLVKCRLPRLHHPIFDLAGFERATDDRFFLLIAASDPQFDASRTRGFLASLEPAAIRELPG